MKHTYNSTVSTKYSTFFQTSSSVLKSHVNYIKICSWMINDGGRVTWNNQELSINQNQTNRDREITETKKLTINI